MGNKKLSIQESIVWNSVGSIIYLLTQWLITILVVRLSGVDVAGNLTLAMSVNNIFYSVAMQGIRNYQVSDVKGKYKDGIYIASRFFACLFAFSICVIYCMVLNYNSMQKMCIVMYCIFKMSEAFFDVYAGVCQKYWRMDYIGKSWIIRGILTFIGFVVTLYITSKLTLAILCMACVSFGCIFFYDIPRTKTIADTTIVLMDRDNFKLMKECFPLLCYLVLSTTIPTIPKLFLERISGSYALGIYGAVSAPTLIVQMGASYIFNPFMTLFAEQYHDGEEVLFRANLKKCFMAIGVLGIVSLIGGKVLGRWGLTLLYGKEVAAYESLLSLLIICTILTATVWMLCGLLTVIREFKGLIISNSVALILGLLISPILIRPIGMQGASLAACISLTLEVLFLYIFLERKLRIRFN